MFAILATFDFSYILRMFYYKWVVHGSFTEEGNWPMSKIMAVIFDPLVFDFLPILLIMVIHSRNFKSLHFTNRAAATNDQ